MQVTAKLRYLRIAPRKMRLLADLIREKEVSEAKSILDFSLKKGAQPLKKLLDSAVSSAKNDFQLEEPGLSVAKITVDEGPKLKRWRARARGRAVQIQKKTSHITLVLEGKKTKAAKGIGKKAPSVRTVTKKADVSAKMGALSLEEQKRLAEKAVEAADKKKEKKKAEAPKEAEEKKGPELEPFKRIKKPKRKILSGLKVKKGGLPKVFRRKSFR